MFSLYTDLYGRQHGLLVMVEGVHEFKYHKDKSKVPYNRHSSGKCIPVSSMFIASEPVKQNSATAWWFHLTGFNFPSVTLLDMYRMYISLG